MKRNIKVYLAFGLAALMAFQQSGAAFAATEKAAVISAAEMPAGGKKVSAATASDAEKAAAGTSAAVTSAASASDAEKALFDADGILQDGAVIQDGVPGAEMLEALLAGEKATPLNAKKSLLDMEIQTADGVFQAGDVLEPEKPKRRRLFSAGGMRAAAGAVGTEAMEEAIAALEEAVNEWDGTEYEVHDGLALGIVADLSSFEIPVEQENKLFSRFLNRNPQYFFLSNSYLSTKTEDELYIAEIAPLIDMTYTIDDIQVFEDKVDEIVSMVDPAWSDEEKVLWLHDYIILTTQYDSDDYANFNAYNCLIDGDAVCQGYTLAYSYLLKQFDIEGDLISSATLYSGDDTTHMGHIWNLVKIDGKNYYVDVTKDDPLESYQYWCRHLNLMNGEARCYANNHKTTDWVDSEGNPVYGKLTVSKDHDNWFWHNCYAAIPYVYGGWVYTDTTLDVRKENHEIRIYRYDDGSDSLLYQYPDNKTDIWRNKATGGRLTSRFIHFAESQDHLLVSGPLNIYWLMEDGIRLPVYELTEDEQDLGNVFGMRADFEDDGIIYYDMYINRTSALQAEHILDLTDQLKELAITTQPADVTAEAGSEARFTVAAEGPAPITYSWEKSADGENWSEVQTATGSDAMKLTVNAAMELDGTKYRCVVSDGKGWFESQTSGTATLTVKEKKEPEPEPVDTSSIVKALAEAATAQTGVEIHDQDPSEVTKETRYVRAAVSKALEDAIAEAQGAMKTAKTTAEAEAAAAKLMKAVNLYRSLIETGSWEKKEVPIYPSSSGGGGGGGAPRTTASSSPEAVSGNWELDNETWYFRNSDGSVPAAGWNYISYNSSVDWYFLDEKGSPLSGWVDSKGFRYYLNPVHDGTFGAMKTGWILIDGIWYYLNPTTGVSSLPGTPFGAMLTDTVTPDGYRVNEKGQYVQEEW